MSNDLKPVSPDEDLVRRIAMEVGVTLRLRRPIVEALKALAEKDRRPFATFLAMILEDYAETKRRKAEGAKERKPK